jgi:carboxyl-terminal processing protease
MMGGVASMHLTRSILKTTTLWGGLFVLPSLAVLPMPARGADSHESNAQLDSATLQQMLGKAEQAELRFDWETACSTYEDILRADRSLPKVRVKYLNSIRRIWQTRRYNDLAFRRDLLQKLTYGQSVAHYNNVVETLLENSWDSKGVLLAAILQKGLEELSFGLADPTFAQHYLSGVDPAEIARFRERLQQEWGSALPSSRAELIEYIREIAKAAKSRLQLNPAVTITELAAGACYAFDNYTAYLTPVQLRELHDSLKGDYVGIGMTLTAQNGKIFIEQVIDGTPAGDVDPPLEQGDEIVSISRKGVGALSVEAAMDLLDGPIGSSIELEIKSARGIRSISLRRRILASVSRPEILRDGVGYLKISCFHETTVQEIDEALAELTKSGMKVLVLDLRGNTGGLFDVAVDVARRFLAEGVVVSKQSAGGVTILHSKNSTALGVPLVVMVDGDTASSAEVLAGAIKDNKRGRLIGEATFGKGCTQSIFRLPNSSGDAGVPTGGLRITVAHFFSPKGASYSGAGVVPDILVDRLFMMDRTLEHHQLDEAIGEAQRLAGL